MTSEEAKVLLHACQSGEPAPDDSRMKEALEQTRRDPELLEWFNQQRALDAAVCQKIQEVRVPPGLPERILAGRKARFAGRRNRYLLPVALAACLVLLLTLAVALSGRFRPPATEFAAFQKDMAGFLVEFPRLDLATGQWGEIARWLAQQPGLTRAEIPPGLQKYPGLGCREVKWRGKSLVLVCFAAQGEVVHLFIIPRAELAGAPDSSTPAFAQRGGWNTASWAHGTVSYLALTKGNAALLKNLFPGGLRG